MPRKAKGVIEGEVLRITEGRNPEDFKTTPSGRPIPMWRGFGGQPRKLTPDDETMNTVRKLARMQATNIEAAAWFEVDEDTWLNFLKLEGVREFWEKHKAGGKMSLRRAQIKAALVDRNPTALIWLGKQLLDQRDERHVSHDVAIELRQKLLALADEDDS